jgi:exosortase
LALTVALYAVTLADMANDWWTDPNLSQGLLIPPLAIWIAWMRRDLTLAEPVMPANRGLLMVAGACLLFLLGKFGAEFFLSRISFVLLIAGLVWTFWGTARLMTLVFPILLLATMVPLPATVYNSLAAMSRHVLPRFSASVSSGMAMSSTSPISHSMWNERAVA